MTMLKGRKICLVSSGHAGSNPRLVKEAAALLSAGAMVHVITVNVTRTADVQRRDHAVLGALNCTSERVEGRPAWRRLYNKLLRRLCARLFQWGWRSSAILLGAYNPMIAPLAAAARRCDAELFIAHNLAALPAALIAASRRNARVGFDAEDFHSGELAPVDLNTLSLHLTRAIEQQYIPRCHYVTAASPGIARAYAEACGIRLPVVVLNVFPQALAPVAATLRGCAPLSPSLYWFSQTIGPDRGLETAIEALALAACRPALYLQGTLSPGYGAVIAQLAQRVGVADRVILLPPCLPDELVALAMQYDAGLASEISTKEPNRDIALTNKLFTYLLAGIPVLASDTRAQAEFARDVGDVVQLYSQHDPTDLARCIDSAIGDAARLSMLRQRAWQLGQQRFNWERQQVEWLNVVGSCLQH